MTTFFLFFFLIYGAIHAVVYARFRALLPPGRPAGLWLALLFLLMILMPVASRLLERAHHDGLARVLAWAGFCWMGLVCLACLAALASWLVQILAWGAARAGLWTPPAGLAAHLAWTALCLAVLASAYAVVEARGVRVERLAIATDKLPAGVERLTIAQVSDVHLGLLNGQRRFSRIVEMIRAEKPDILVSTGDMVDGNLFEEDGLADLWAGLPAPLGKFAVVGNHEVYAGLGQALEFLRRAGFTVLRDRAARPGGLLNVVGVDDPAVFQRRPPELAPPPPPALRPQDLPPGLFTLLLYHRPVVLPGWAGRFDLQLAGHTHGGQIFPFNLVTGAIYPMQDGLYHLADGSRLYTSRGTGTWGPPMRLGAPPLITIFELTRRP